METLSQTPRVVFGDGAEAATAALLVELGARRVLIVAAARHDDGAQRIAAALGERAVGIFLTDGPQVPAEVAARAVAAADAGSADWVLAHGGGTPIGVAKAIALERPVRLAAVPTTYAGSERTDIWGIVRDGQKTTGRDPRVRPALVVYDPALTRDLPRDLSLQSLLNALAHAIEAVYAVEATPEARAGAHAALGPLLRGLEAIARDPSDAAGRAEALRGAAQASAALGGASMGLHHKLAHVLGGSLDTPHAATHAVLLPYTLGFNAPASVATVEACWRAWGSRDPAAFLYDRMRAWGLPTSLRSLGLTEAHVDGIVAQALAASYANPRPIDADGLRALLHDALHDRRPSLGSGRLPGVGDGPHAVPPRLHRGAPLDRADAVILAIHGRGASAERFAADLERRIGPRPGVAIVAPQARDNTWYPRPFSAPPADNQPHLDSALAVIEASWRALEAQVGADRIVLAGFSQGACLLATWLSTTSARPRRALLFTGAPTPIPDAPYTAAAGLRLHVGASASDPWVDRATLDAAVARFRAAGAIVSATLVPGDAHGIHAPDEVALREAVEQALAGDDLRYHEGLGPHASEARPGALPRHQNSPRHAPYGLIAEQINGTPFTTRRADNQRTWMYRLRPAIQTTGFRERPAGRFVGAGDAAGVPLPEVLSVRPSTGEAGDFLAGLTTFAGAGDPSLARGGAVHSYAADRELGPVALCDVDGDLLFVPVHGRLHLRTELGRMTVAPGQIAVVPRGLRFTVTLPDGAARGWLGELYDGHFRLPERGVVGANGLADERHFRVPVADFVDDPRPWTIVVRSGGRLWEVDSPHDPFDVVAWHGNYVPFTYDLARFASLGAANFDHPDPSILTVLTCPVDERGRSAFDVAVFRGRTDASRHTFRPAFAHRNAAVEFNGVIRAPAGSRFAPGHVLFTPAMTPHAVSGRTYVHQIVRSDAEADAPEHIPDDSLWIQFESVYPWRVMPWVLEDPARDRDHLRSFDYPPPERG